MNTALIDRLPAVLMSYGLPGTAQLHRFSVAARVQHRSRAPGISEAVAKARADKATTDRPFWDALFRQIGEQPADVRADILAQAAYHHDMAKVATSTSVPLTSASAIAEAISAQLAQLGSGQIMAISSRLISDSGTEWHIPMLDYRVPVSDENQAILVGHLAAMNVPGMLLHSGRSYHFIGSSLLAGLEGLVSFLGRSLLYAPLVDGRWIGHQLIEGSCSLRLTSGDTNQVPPYVVAQVGGAPTT